ncbi:oxidoreductase [Phyllosticta citrichinensis]
MTPPPITWQHDADYEKARIGRVFNYRRPSRYPIAVVEASEESHVDEAVRLAIQKQCRISIRSGGHAWAVWSVRDDAVLLDLGRFKEIELDEKTGIVKVSPSVTGRELNELLQRKGVMFAGGHCPDVGLGGFLLQGGMGWNCKVLGAFNISSNDVARGAGPGFPAVVTRFYLQTRPAYTCMRSSAYTYAKKDFKKAMNWILSVNFRFYAEVAAVGAFTPESAEPYTTILFVTFKNSEVEALAALKRAEDSHPPGAETGISNEYIDQGAANPNRYRYRVDNAYINDDADVADVLEDAFTTLPTRKSFSLWLSMAPGSRRLLRDMALSMQSDHYFATCVMYEDAAEDVVASKWVQSIMKKVEQRSEGAYLGDADFQRRQTRFWGDEQGRRLMDLVELST